MSQVVPLVGTWIEMISAGRAITKTLVVPLVGTWIEIVYPAPEAGCDISRSSRRNVD